MSDDGEFAEVVPGDLSWIWVAYPFDQWSWSEMNGWVNPEDDPATPTEAVLLDEIERLRDRLAMNGVDHE